MGGQRQASRLRKQLWKHAGSWVALRLSAGRTALGNLGASVQGGQYTDGCDADGLGGCCAQGRGVLGGGCRRVGGADCTNLESDTRRGRVCNHTRLPRGRLEAVCNATTREDPCLRKPRHHDPSSGLLPYNPTKSVLPPDHVNYSKRANRLSAAMVLCCDTPLTLPARSTDSNLRCQISITGAVRRGA
jgi:hypothetical protein